MKKYIVLWDLLRGEIDLISEVRKIFHEDMVRRGRELIGKERVEEDSTYF